MSHVAGGSGVGGMQAAASALPNLTASMRFNLLC